MARRRRNRGGGWNEQAQQARTRPGAPGGKVNIGGVADQLLKAYRAAMNDGEVREAQAERGAEGAPEKN